MTNIESSICDAIEIIVERSISQANFDKTIQATIIKCIDQTIGKYVVRYQDSTFYAYSGSSDVTYTNGSTVYILIPGNNTEADKTILGTTKKLGINYVSTIEDDEAYQIVGNNCVMNSSASFNLQSYRKDKQVKVLYSKQYTVNQNLINLNKTAINEYIKNQQTIICGATIRTALPAEQQFRGNYGLIFALNFTDNTNNSVVTRYYTVDVDKMRGNPYKILYDTRQYGIFDIDGENFVDVDSISIFCYDFPNTKPDSQCIDDIFIRDVELCGAERLSDDDISNYSLTFHTPQGIYFDSTSLISDTRSIEAQVRVKGKVIDNASQPLPFYWFIEHVGITSESEYYNKNGGQGWKCLNQFNEIKKATASDPRVVEWIPANSIWTVKKSDVMAKEVRYKCAVVYDGTVISKIITIKNLSSNYDIKIESSDGTQFYFDNGYPTLTCKVNGVENKAYTYSWAVTNNVGNFETLPDTPLENSAYQKAYDDYNTLLRQIQNEYVPLEPNKERLENLRNDLARYDRITRVDKNNVYHLNVNTITNFSTYQCTVYYGQLYLGTASIVLKNDLTAEGEYSLVIHDSSNVFKYDENGISPASNAVDSPINLQALTFSVYNNLGERIDDEIVRHSDIKWVVPITNTMLRIPNVYGEYEEDLVRGVRIYKNLMSFAYEIEDRYDITKSNNNIEVMVNYNGVNLSNKTDFVFVKEGDAGTNGTEFTCRIIPNIRDGARIPAYPMATIHPDYRVTYNFNYKSLTQLLRVQLWHNEKKIFDAVQSGNTTEGKAATVTWEVLKNKYTASVSDNSAFTISENTGVFGAITYRSADAAPANIIKATIVYDGVTYYATIPFVTVNLSNDNYEIALKEGSGFFNAVYSSDGQRPRYDNVNPFELVVTQNIGGYKEDVTEKTSSTYAVNYTWNYQIGKIYEESRWVNSYHLGQRVEEVSPHGHQCAVKPLDSYDGQCVTNAIEAIVKKGSTEIGRIHIPIHLLLNRYGNSAINSWDGNSVQVDKDGGFILAPQMGAGIKNSDNSFTGVLMGKVKETNKSAEDIGIVGYHKGVRSIFLDSEDGSAIFGTKNNGKFIIDPSSNKALLYSWNYWKNYNDKGKPSNYNDSNKNNKGMLINLTDSLIHLGSAESGKIYSGEHTSLGSTKDGFYLSQDGLSIGTGFTIAANGKSDINHKDSNLGHWYVTEDGLISNDANGILLDSNNSTIHLIGATGKIYSAKHKTFADNTETGFYLANDGLSIVSKYKRGTENVTSRIEMSTAGDPKLYSNNHSGLASTRDGFYLGHDGLSIGKNFVISSSGNVLMNEDSDIGNWKVVVERDASGNPIQATNSYGNLLYIGANGRETTTNTGIKKFKTHIVSKDGTGIYLDSNSSTIVLGSSTGKIYSGQHTALSNNKNGFFLSNDGLSIGSKVYIDNTGTMRLGSGAYNNTGKHWEIASDTSGESYIKYGNMNDTKSVYIATNMMSLGKKFYVDNSGVMRIGSGATAGTGGKYWTIDGGTESYIGYNATASYLTTTSNEVSIGDSANANSVYLGTDGIRLGKKFAVDKSGNVLMKYFVATGGKIAGWTIDGNKLVGQKSDGHYIELNSNGSIKTGVVEGENGWEIKRNGNAVFRNITANGKGDIGGATLSNGKLTVHTAQIDTAAITTAKIADAAITNAKIKDATIQNAKIVDATITNAKIANLTITGAKIAGSTITGNKIASATIDNSNIKNGTITGAKIASSTITGSKIASSTIEGSNIKNGTITGAKISDATITNAKISGKISANHIDADSLYVKAAHITGTLSARQINTSGLSIGAGQITVTGYVGNNNKHEGQTFSMHFLRNLTDQMIIYFCKGICVGYSQN